MNDRLQAQRLTNEAFAVVSQGLSAESQGRFDDAKPVFERALRALALAVQADPTYEHAHNERAFVLLRLNREEEAAESARRAIALAPHVPKFRMALIGLGLKQVERHKTRESRTRLGERYRGEIEETTKAFPRYASGFLAHATLCAMIGAGQSQWEASLTDAARVYSRAKRMASGEPASEAAIAQAMKLNIIHCLELAREWDRLPD